MKPQRHVSNKKKAFADLIPHAERVRLAGKVCYDGSPWHKRNPGDFGFDPPSKPRPDKSLCDDAGVFSKSEAERLLKEGVLRGLVSKQRRGGFPQNIWAVSQTGVPVEAMLGNKVKGCYHGYPLMEEELFSRQVLEKWKDACDG